MIKSMTAKGLSIILALALLCSMGLMTLVLSSPSTAGAQPWSMYFAQTYVMEDEGEDNQVWVSIMHEDQSVTDVQITTNGDGEEGVSDPSVAIAPNGNIIVAWENYEGDYSQIHYAVLDNNGAVIKGETALTSTNYDNYDPSVAVTPDGKVFIAWESGPEGDDPVAYAILDSSGNILSAQTTITRPDDIDDPTVATSTKDASNNNVVIAWEEEDGDDGPDQVWFTVLNSAGGTEVTATKVTSTSQDSEEINAAVLPNGNFAIVWEDYDGSDQQIWFTIRGADGSIVKGNTKLTTSNESSDDPSVAATPGGDIVIIWEESVPDEDESVFYAILNGSGNVVKAIAEVTTSSLDDDDCDVAIDRNGNMVISWEHRLGEEEEEVNERVSFAILAPGGAIVTTDQALTDGTYDILLDGGEGKRNVATKPTTTPSRPVGGEAFSPDKMAVVAPWVMLAIAITTGTGMLIRRRRTAS
jgi:hypothetical protein